MAILYRKDIVWNCATGRVPGADYLADGSVYRGFIYYRDIKTVGGLTRLDIKLSTGVSVRMHNDQQTAGNERVEIHRRGHTQDGYTILEIVPKTVRDFVGVQFIEIQAFYKTSSHDYNALSRASFDLWESSSNGGVVLPTGTKKNLLDDKVEHTWYNDLVSLDAEVVKFAPHPGDRLVHFVFKTDIIPDGAGGDPFVQWVLQLRRSDDTLVAAAPSVFHAVSQEIKARQVSLAVYIRGDDDPLVEYGVIPEIHNIGANPVKFEFSQLHIYTVDTPQKPYIDYYGM